jgi:hypothetical protein
MNYMQNQHIERLNNAILINNIKLQLEEANLPRQCIIEDGDDSYFRVLLYLPNQAPNSDERGYIIINKPEGGRIGLAHMGCCIGKYNDCFTEVIVNSIDAMIELISFCLSLLPYQPNAQNFDYVRIPPHLLNHWCVRARLRNLNLAAIEHQNDVQ